MKIGFRWSAFLIATTALVMWIALPIFSFVLFVPLIQINGWICATTINQFMYIPIIMTVMMMTAALIGHRGAMQLMGVAQFIICFVILFSQKSILLSGNMGWVSSLIRAIMNKFGDKINVDLSHEKIDMALNAIRLTGSIAGHYIPENELNTIIYLLEKLGNLLGMKLTGESIMLMLDTIVSECIQMGTGFILHTCLVGGYVLIGFLAPKKPMIFQQTIQYN